MVRSGPASNRCGATVDGDPYRGVWRAGGGMNAGRPPALPHDQQVYSTLQTPRPRRRQPHHNDSPQTLSAGRATEGFENLSKLNS